MLTPISSYPPFVLSPYLHLYGRSNNFFLTWRKKRCRLILEQLDANFVFLQIGYQMGGGNLQGFTKQNLQRPMHLLTGSEM